jgi:hypothetical protein
MLKYIASKNLTLALKESFYLNFALVKLKKQTKLMKLVSWNYYEIENYH